MERIFKAESAHGFEVFISPHYVYPTDKGWKFNGALETDEVTSRMFARKGMLNLDGFEGSGADWLERFKPYVQDGKTIVVAPHRVRARDQRPCSAAPQTQDQQDHSWRNARQHLSRISLARIARARFRSSRRERCDGCAKASRMGLQL
jgi:hypothetical protein